MAEGTSQFIDQQRGAGKLESTGAFRIEPEKLAGKYKSVLEEDFHGVLFFFQSAELLRAKDVKCAVGRDRFEFSMRIEDFPEHGLPQGDLLPTFRQLFHQDHPLYGLAHGANILINAKRTRELTFVAEDNRMKLVWVFKVYPKLVDMFATKLSLILYQRLYSQHCKVNFDGLELENQKYPVTLLANLFHSEAPCPEPIVIFDPREPLITLLPEKKVNATLLGSEYKWRVFTNSPAPPLFEAKSPIPNQCAYLYHRTSYCHTMNRCYIVPSKHGVLLEPIESEYNYGHGLMIFDANALKTDFSGLKLIQNEEYHEALFRVEALWIELIELVRRLSHHYQPVLNRKQATVRTTAAVIGIPALIAGGLALGGAPLLAKSSLALKFMGIGSAMGFLHQGRYIFNPEAYTEETRREMFAWLNRLPEREELIAMLEKRYGRKV